MPSLEKLLSRFDKNDRGDIEALVSKIVSLDWRGLNVRKLKGYQDVFRVRKGSIRVIYRMEDKKVFILAIERRSEKTYEKF